jgi:anti-anti-sigma regulatory factor
MQVKIDTKEKFTVVTPIGPVLTANIAAEISDWGKKQLAEPVKNVIMNLSDLTGMEEKAGETICLLQQHFYENNASFVLCCLQPLVEEMLTNWEMIDLLNITPTESEAWDIVQMEEIERELLDGEDIEFGKD